MLKIFGLVLFVSILQLRIFVATSYFAAFHKMSKVDITKLLHWFWKLFLLPLIDHNESILTTHFGCGKLSLVEVKSLSVTSLFSEVFSVKFSQIFLLKSKQVWIRNSEISQNKKNHTLQVHQSQLCQNKKNSLQVHQSQLLLAKAFEVT